MKKPFLLYLNLLSYLTLRRIGFKISFQKVQRAFIHAFVQLHFLIKLLSFTLTLLIYVTHLIPCTLETEIYFKTVLWHLDNILFRILGSPPNSHRKNFDFPKDYDFILWKTVFLLYIFKDLTNKS